MLASPAPKYYLVGALLFAIGALALLLRGRRRGGDASRPWAVIAVGVVALSVGLVAIATGISIDLEYNAGFNTTTFSYHVSLQMNGSWPVQILLPAPSDARLYDALNVTNGSATLRLNHTASGTNVVLTARANTTFQVQTQIPTAAVDRNFTRLTACGFRTAGYTCNTSIVLDGAPTGMKVRLILIASIGVVCEWRTFSFESWIQDGAMDYPVFMGTMVY